MNTSDRSVPDNIRGGREAKCRHEPAKEGRDRLVADERKSGVIIYS